MLSETAWARFPRSTCSEKNMTHYFLIRYESVCGIGAAHRPEAHPPVQLPDDPLLLFLGPGQTRIKYVAALVLGLIIDLAPVSRNRRV